MSKLTLTCGCGQEMLVPESAMGKVGLCPQCGREVTITRVNTREIASAPPAPRRPGSGLLNKRHAVRRVNELREESSRKFANAVDLYNNKRYAEALAILDGLMSDFPDNGHVQSAREECLRALHGLPALPRTYDERPVAEQTLNADLVRSVILEKLLHGDDATQLQAADLAARLLGILGNGHAPQLHPGVTPDALLVRPGASEGKGGLARAVRAAVDDALRELYLGGAKPVRRKSSEPVPPVAQKPFSRKPVQSSRKDDEIS